MSTTAAPSVGSTLPISDTIRSGRIGPVFNSSISSTSSRHCWTSTRTRSIQRGLLRPEASASIWRNVARASPFSGTSVG